MRKPGFTDVRLTKLRISKPAPTSSISASATSDATIASASRRARRLVVPRPASCRTSVRLGRIARHAGTSPTSRPDATASAAVNARTGRSRPIWSARGTVGGMRTRSTRTPAHARPSPTTAPEAASSPLSTSDCAHQREAAGAKRRAHREVTRRPGGPRQHQVRHVGARDQQHQPHRAEQHPERPADAAHHLLVRRHQLHAPPRVRVGMLLRQFRGNRVHLGLRLRDRLAGRQPSDDPVHPVRAREQRPGVERERRPQLHLAIARGELEPVRHHADHFERLTIELQRLARHVRAAAEPALPGAVADDREPLVPGQFFLVGEDAADHRLHAKDAEERGRRLDARDTLRLVRARQREPAMAKRAHGRQPLRLPSPIQVGRP